MTTEPDPEMYEGEDADLRFRTALKQCLRVPLSPEETAALERIREDLGITPIAPLDWCAP